MQDNDTTAEMFPVGRPPQWARELYLRVFAEVCVPSRPLHWRRSRQTDAGWDWKAPGEYDRRIDGMRRAGSGGVCYPTHIVLTVGRERRDQLVVLLHEIAHALTEGVEPSAHGPIFWDTAWGLLDQYAPQVPRRYILDREGSYRLGALDAAERRGVRGVKAARARIYKARGWRR